RDGHEPGDVVDVLRLFLTHVQRYVDVAHQVGRERRSEGRAVKDAAIPLLVDVSPLQADEDRVTVEVAELPRRTTTHLGHLAVLVAIGRERVVLDLEAASL